MRWCRSCGRLSVGRPSFCTRCGRSFDVRICTRGHVNRRDATFCVVCGSPELSTPHRRRSAWRRIAVGLSILLGAVLFAWYCLALLNQLVGSDLTIATICLILLLAITTGQQTKR